MENTFESTQETEIQNSQDPTQLPIELDVTAKERVGNFQNKLDDFEIYFEAIPFWKNAINVFCLVSIIAIFLISELLILESLADLPNNVPFFYNTTDNAWDVMPKNVLIWIPVILLVAQLIAYAISFKLYNFDKRLVRAINFSLMFAAILFLLGLGQLLSMTLI